MDDVEEGLLERRLRRSVAGHSPAAPEWLVGFVETVPARHRTAGRLALAFDGPRVRLGIFATIAVAAAFLAIVGSATLVAVRNGQNVDPGAPSLSGWSWQKADGTLVDRAYPVANGYLGVCGANQDQMLCSSPDGLGWTAPPDPSIAVVEENSKFIPWEIARSGGIYVATAPSSYSNANPSTDATPTPVEVGAQPVFPDRVVWRSSDGVHWTRVQSASFGQVDPDATITVREGGFMLFGLAPDGSSSTFTSSDGLTWTKSSSIPIEPNCAASGAAGLILSLASAQPDMWRSIDGKSWSHVVAPSDVCSVVSYSAPGGGFLGYGWSNTGGMQLLRSVDGLTWHADQGDLRGTPLAYAAVGDRIFADVSAEPLNSSAYPDDSTFAAKAFAIWQSADGGRTWQQLLDASGRQMSGMVMSLGDRLSISSPDASSIAWRIAWVGTPPGMSPKVPVVPDATGPVPAPTAVGPAATMPGTAGPAPTSGEASQPTPPVTPSGGISQADAIRLAAAALADSPHAAPSSAAQVEAGQASLVYGNPIAVEPQARWVWLITYGARSGTGSGGEVVIDYATGVVVGIESWTP